MSDDTITAPPLPSSARGRRPRHLLHVLWPVSSTVVLTPQPVVVGRTDGALRFSEDNALSRRHAEIRVADDSVRLTDLDSHNGTWRNGVRLRGCILEDGDVVRMGGTFVLYRRAVLAPEDAAIPGVLGVSLAIRAVRAALVQLGPTDATVLLLGETGTGKSLAARALHDLSGRKGPFLPINCAALPDSVAESVLFGHRAGAFTDARSDQRGLFRAADKGTLFLDEIGLLSPAMQGRLLLAIESGHILPVGESRPVPVDVRLLGATNEDLSSAVSAGRFRPDLYARLADAIVTLPPLRQRREDVVPLFQAAMGPSAPALTADVVDLLLRWDWPFNVREVAKLAADIIRRCAGAPQIEAAMLPARYSLPASSARVAEADGPPDREALCDMLRDVGGNVSELARRTDRSTKQIYRWCSRHGIDPSDYRA